MIGQSSLELSGRARVPHAIAAIYATYCNVKSLKISTIQCDLRSSVFCSQRWLLNILVSVLVQLFRCTVIYYSLYPNYRKELASRGLQHSVASIVAEFKVPLIFAALNNTVWTFPVSRASKLQTRPVCEVRVAKFKETLHP